MKEPFLEGFVSGSIVVIVLLAVILLYLALKKGRKGRSQESIEGEAETVQSGTSKRRVKALKSCCVLVGGAVFVLAIFHVYLTGVRHYEGVVRDKVMEEVEGQEKRSRYFVTIDTVNYQVEQSLYDAVNVGDTLRKPVLRPWMYVNDRKVFPQETIRDSGFWTGFVGSACAVMCLWSLVGAFRPPRRSTTP